MMIKMTALSAVLCIISCDIIEAEHTSLSKEVNVERIFTNAEDFSISQAIEITRVEVDHPLPGTSQADDVTPNVSKQNVNLC